MSVDISSFSVIGGMKTDSVEMPKTAAPATALPISMLEEKPLNERVEAVAEVEQPVETQKEAQAEEVEEQVSDDSAQEVVENRPSSSKFSVLARKEAQLFRERERLKAERAQVQAQLDAVKEFEAKKARAKLDPLSVLNDLGLTYEQVSEFVVNGNKPTVSAEVQAVRDEIERLRTEQEESRVAAERNAEERLNRERELIIDQFNMDAINYVNDNASKFEYTIANDGAHYVPEIIEKHFFKTGELLSIDKAAEIVESHFEGIAERVAKAGKFKAKTVVPSVAQTAASSAQQSQQAAAPVKRQATLTNSMTASASAQATQRRTEQDRIRAALARLEGK